MITVTGEIGKNKTDSVEHKIYTKSVPIDYPIIVNFNLVKSVANYKEKRIDIV